MLRRGFCISFAQVLGVVAMVMSSSFCCRAQSVKWTETQWEEKMTEYGLVDIATVDPTIIVDLKYATTDNFVGENMYGSLCRAYLRPEIAEALKRVQTALKKRNPAYSLIIYDAARPQSVQKLMYDRVKDTKYSRYVAKPYKGGHHNFGVAVDISIACDGVPLDMGTGFDSFSVVSHIDNEDELLRTGKITKEALANRRLLRKLMKAEGFTTYRREWWHFQQYEISYARANLRLLDF